MQDLRKQLRTKRQSLTKKQQQSHSLSALKHLNELLKTQPNGAKIAFFISQDGELETSSSIQLLWKENYRVYLPVLECQPDTHMAFAQYSNNSKMTLNKFGILEPVVPFEAHCKGEEMNVVLVPLVGFDADGNRLGMGGGYYDRTFEFKSINNTTQPLLVGWAHSCQEVAKLISEPWDVPLDAIITEKGYTQFSNKKP